MTCGLVGGHYLGDHLVDPDLVGDRPRGRRVVAGEQDGSQAERLQPPDRLGGGRLYRVGDDEHRRGLPVPAGGDRSLAARLGRLPGGVERGRELERPVDEQGGPAGDDGVSVDDALDAEPLAIREPFDRRQRRPALAAVAIARAIGCSEASSSAPTSRSASSGSTPSATATSSSVICPVVTVPVLSSTIVSIAPRRFEDLRALDQQPELRAAAGSDHRRGRGREPERARAGDDQHGDRGNERERRALPGAEPEAERRDRDREDGGDEDAGDPVGEPLHRRLAGLRLGHEAGDLRERGVAADPGGPDDQPSAGVDRRPGDLGAGADLHRDRLVGQHAHVDR